MGSPSNNSPWGMRSALIAGLLVGLQNLGKPVHIDDALYLHVAKQIVNDPLNPYGGIINWQQSPEPAYKVSISPPLLSYQFAAVIAACGESEFWLHASMIPWTVLAAWSLYRLSQRYCSFPLQASLLVLLAPAVVVGLNLMLDVPLLASMLLCIEASVRFADQTRRWRWAALAVVAGAAATLLKFSGVVLAPLAFVIALDRRQWKPLVGAVGPAVAYFTWQHFCQTTYGSAQTEQGLSFLQRFKTDLMQMVWQRSLTMAVIIAMTFPGCLALIAVFSRKLPGQLQQRNTLTLVAWIAGPAAFAILFGPFVAVRSFLPSLPPLAWGIARVVATRSLARFALAASVVVTLTLSALLQWADWRWAAIYPRVAAAIAAKHGDKNKTIYFLGHWGWQYYCERAGFVPWNASDYVPPFEALFIVPLRPDRQRVFPYITRLLRPIETIEIEPHPLGLTTWNRQRGIRFYGGDFGEIPWGLSREWTDRIVVCELVATPADEADPALFPPEKSR